MKRNQRKWRVLAAGFLALSTGKLAHAARQNHFIDVPPDHWAYDAVNELAELGILVGYPSPIRGTSHPSKARQRGAAKSEKRQPRRSPSTGSRRG